MKRRDGTFTMQEMLRYNTYLIEIQEAVRLKNITRSTTIQNKLSDYANELNSSLTKWLDEEIGE